MRLVYMVCAFLLAGVLACAADVTGKWKADYTSPDGQARQSTFDLKAEGNKLTGTMMSPRGDAPIQDGKIDGESISFTVVRNFNGQEIKLQYNGKISGDEIKFTVHFNENSFEMTAKRVPS